MYFGYKYHEMSKIQHEKVITLITHFLFCEDFQKEASMTEAQRNIVSLFTWNKSISRSETMFI